MTAKEAVIHQTWKAVDAFFAIAKEIPAEKLEWSPLDKGRTVLDQAREVALSATWGSMVLTDGKMPDFTPELMAEFERMKQAIPDLAACEELCRKNTEGLVEVILNFPESELGKKVAMPWGGEWTMLDFMGIHAWNCSYHEGQLNYIKILAE